MKKVWFCNQRCTLLKIQNFQQDLHGTTWHLHIHFASYAYAQLVKPLVFTLVSRPCWQYICCQRTCAPQTVVFPLLFLSVHEAPEDWEPTGNQSGGQQIVPFLPACIVMTWSHECMTSKILVFVTLIGDCYVGPCTPNSNFYWWMWGEGVAGRYALIGRHFPELDVLTQIYLVKSTGMQHLPLLFEVGQRCKLDFLHWRYIYPYWTVKITSPSANEVY